MKESLKINEERFLWWIKNWNLFLVQLLFLLIVNYNHFCGELLNLIVSIDGFIISPFFQGFFYKKLWWNSLNKVSGNFRESKSWNYNQVHHYSWYFGEFLFTMIKFYRSTTNMVRFIIPPQKWWTFKVTPQTWWVQLSNHCFRSSFFHSNTSVAKWQIAHFFLAIFSCVGKNAAPLTSNHTRPFIYYWASVFNSLLFLVSFHLRRSLINENCHKNLCQRIANSLRSLCSVMHRVMHVLRTKAIKSFTCLGEDWGEEKLTSVLMSWGLICCDLWKMGKW